MEGISIRGSQGKDRDARYCWWYVFAIWLFQIFHAFRFIMLNKACVRTVYWRSDYLKGTLWVDEFVTHHQKLDDINKGFDDMHVSLFLRFLNLSLSRPSVLPLVNFERQET